MMKEMNVTLKPYDRDVANNVYSVLFYGSDKSTEDGLMEIPTASYQLVVSALELMLWEVRKPDEREAFKKTIGIVAGLMETQKDREWKRRDEA